jgi:diacylglycerol kinase family enzyme
VTALAQNSDPFTYFSKQPVHVCENVEIDDGALGMILLKRANLLDMGMVVPRLLTQKLRAAGHGQVEAFEKFTEARVRSGSTDESGLVREFPVQVDGDYIGTFEEITLTADPGALTIIA